MKTHDCSSLLTPALLVFTLLVVPANLSAEPAPEKKLTPNQQQYDADKSGQLSDEEKAAAKEAAKAKAKETREANLEKYDANKDGKLDKDERAQKKADEEAARAAKKAEKAAKKGEKS